MFQTVEIPQDHSKSKNSRSKRRAKKDKKMQ